MEYGRIVNDYFINVSVARLKCTFPDDACRPKHVGTNFDSLLTMHLNIFTLILTNLMH
jgi:hypothetical protein